MHARMRLLIAHVHAHMYTHEAELLEKLILAGLKKTDNNTKTQTPMKQTMKSKAGDQCRTCTEGMVSSARGISYRLKLFRCQETNLKQQLMTQHANDITPWPLKTYGPVGGSCRELKWLIAEQTHFKPASKVQYRGNSTSGIGLSDFGYQEDGDVRSGKCKLTRQTQVGNCDFLYYESNLPGASECVDATEFRRQSDWLSFSNAKTGEIAITTNICSLMELCIGSCIIISKITQLPYRLLNGRFGVIASTTRDNQKPVKIKFRWQITVHSDRMVEISKLRKLRDAAAIEFFHRFSEN